MTEPQYEASKCLEEIAGASKRALEMIKANGFVFKSDLTKSDLTDSERWEKLAFSLYSNLVHESTRAQHALECMKGEP